MRLGPQSSTSESVLMPPKLLLVWSLPVLTSAPMPLTPVPFGCSHGSAVLAPAQQPFRSSVAPDSIMKSFVPRERALSGVRRIIPFLSRESFVRENWFVPPRTSVPSPYL